MSSGQESDYPVFYASISTQGYTSEICTWIGWVIAAVVEYSYPWVPMTPSDAITTPAAKALTMSSNPKDHVSHITGAEMYAALRMHLR